MHSRKAACRWRTPYSKKLLAFERLENRVVLSTTTSEIVFSQIVNGQSAPFRPEVVEVQSTFGKYGSGTFITRQDILTAAHVVDLSGDFHYNPAQDGVITVHITDGSDIRNAGAKTYRVVSVTVHPGYSQITDSAGRFLSTRNDLAILHLETFANDVIPVPILRRNPTIGETVEILGFGRTGTVPGPTFANQFVRQRGFTAIDTIDSSAHLIGWTLDFANESGNSSGDSGGPAFIIEPDGQRRLAGVDSYGTGVAQYGATAREVQVNAYASWIDSVVAANNSTGPTATLLRNDNVTTPGSLAYNVRVRYAAANGFPTNVNPRIALVGPNNYYNEFPAIGLSTLTVDHELLTVDYRFDGPGGTWSAANNGSYSIYVLNNGLVDSLGHPTGSSYLGSFNVILPADTSPPTASSSSGTSISSPGRPNYVISVTYSDAFGIKGSSLGNDDVLLVKSDGSFSTSGRLMVQGTMKDRTALIAMYEFAAPGGTWDSSDNGTYNIVLRAGSVRDVTGNLIGGGILNSFSVNIAPGAAIAPWAILNAPNIATETATETFTITYYGGAAINVATIQQDHADIFYDVQVFASNGQYNYDAHLVGLSQTNNGSPITATYQWTEPYPWTAADNGVYMRVFLSGSAVTDVQGRTLQGAGYIGMFQVRVGGGVDTQGPQAVLFAPDVTLANSKNSNFDVQFTDDHAVSAITVTSDSLYVIGPAQQQYALQLADVNYGQDVPSILATFSMSPPGGEWDEGDNGLYHIMARDGVIQDAEGNFLAIGPLGDLGQFAVAISPIAPASLPTVSASITNITHAEVFHTVTVTYTDNSGSEIDASTLGDDDVYLTNGNGFVQFAQLVSIAVGSNGNPLIATYHISGLSGRWNESDSGQYEIYSAGDAYPAVLNLNGVIVPGGFLGAFSVSITPSAQLFGDYNTDGIVDAADYVLWRHANGTHIMPFSGSDGSGNGVVDRDDYLVWRIDYGTAATIVADDYGDNAASAGNVDVPGMKDGSIGSSSDVDWFSFAATVGSSYAFQTTLDSLANSSLRLIDIDGLTQLVADSDSGPALIKWTAPATGTYFLEVSGVGGATGSYHLSFARDDHSDFSETATFLPAIPLSGFTFWLGNGVIERANDVDWFRITSHDHPVSLDGLLGSPSNIAVEVYGVTAGEGLALLASDTDGGEAHIEFFPYPVGDTFIKIAGFAGSTGSYSFSLSASGGSAAAESATLTSPVDITQSTGLPVVLEQIRVSPGRRNALARPSFEPPIRLSSAAIDQLLTSYLASTQKIGEKSIELSTQPIEPLSFLAAADGGAETSLLVVDAAFELLMGRQSDREAECK